MMSFANIRAGGLALFLAMLVPGPAGAAGGAVGGGASAQATAVPVEVASAAKVDVAAPVAVATGEGVEAAGEVAAEAEPDVRRDEYAGVMLIGERKLGAKDAESALIAFREALRLARGEEETAPALLNLARAHRLAGDGVKAVATYELLLRDFPAWSQVPLALLELGRSLRDLGAHRLAIARFYSVIHSTLRMPEAETRVYRQLVRTAQFEIAETHMAAGDAGEAARFFRRLDTLDLAPADRARARFRAAEAELMEGDREAAVQTLSRYLALDPRGADADEARFLLARLHAEAGRREEALAVTLELLRSTQTEAKPEAAREWRRRAGHFLAAKYRDEDDAHSALLLYRALAELDAAPGWRAPLLYQIGISLERLGQAEKAREAYAELRALVDPADASLAELARMAAWRAEQLEWMGRAEEAARRLAPARQTVSLNAPVTP